MNFSNNLLVALPDMQDPRFKQAVILICEHNQNGAMGLVINNPIKDIDTNHVFTELNLNQPTDNQIVLDGGPVNQSNGFMLHNDTKKYKSSLVLQDNLTMTTSKDLLDEIAEHKYINNWQFILGYSGWDKNQLEEEMAQNTWLNCPVNLDLIFHTPVEDRWNKALSLIGIHDANSISGAGHA